ncbi:MAG: helix-turn-helix domain-containing protein [Bacilli bacterium]
MSIGSNIKEYRKNREISQMELANKLGVEQETIVNWENNLETPTENQVSQIASALGVSYFDLVENEKHSNIIQNVEVENIENLFRGYLNAGEVIQWSGKPKRNPKLHHLPLTAFGLVFLSFSIFWTIMASKMTSLMALFGIPFIIVGVYLVFGKKLQSRTINTQIYYAVTDERILILRHGGQDNLIQVNINQLTNVILTPSIDNTSSITFYSRNEMGFYNSRPYFYYIEKGDYVVNLINNLRNKQKQ